MSDDSAHSTELSGNELPKVQGARILAVLDAAKEAAGRSATGQKAISSLVARQHAQLEAVQEAGQRLGARGRDLRNSSQLVRESVDRAKLTALNTGLEGARLGEPVGKALVVMGDEVRNSLARALDALEEHTALLAEVDRDRDRYLADVAQISNGAREVGSQLARAEQQVQLTSALLFELRTDLGEVFSTDAEAARTLTSSAAQVKTLANSLLELSQRFPLGVSALRELLEPLLSLVPASGDTDRER